VAAALEKVTPTIKAAKEKALSLVETIQARRRPGAARTLRHGTRL